MYVDLVTMQWFVYVAMFLLVRGDPLIICGAESELRVPGHLPETEEESHGSSCEPGSLRHNEVPLGNHLSANTPPL